MAARKTPPPAKATGGKAASGKGGSSARAAASSGTARTSAAKASAAKAGAAKAGATKSGATKVSTSKPTSRPGGTKGPAQRPPTRRKKNKSIVNQKQTPWGLIITAVVIVAFAAAVIGVVVATHKSGTDAAVSHGGQSVDSSDPYRQPELAAAAKIKGVTYRVEGQHNHVEGHIKYDSSPPVGGNHSQYWADCTGTVYPKAIANENAVHMLEHGAVWITYNSSTLPAAQLTKLKTYVSGIDRMALSPYPNLKTPISLQSWGYQLFVKNASDPRIAEFISALKYNQKVTPEYGATCSQPTFKADPSTFGHPLWVPKAGATGNTSGQ